MPTPLLSDLREPPEVGRFYMVPVVERFPSFGVVRDWPVLGPLHDDAEFFNFNAPHYHVDVRFLGVRDHRLVASKLGWTLETGDVERDAAFCASGRPINDRYKPLPKGRPVLRRLRCKRGYVETPLLLHADAAREAMTKRYGNPCEPILRQDGRKLCPHRKVDLSSFPPDGLGIVVCPLHGLRVRCGEPAHG